MRTATVKIGEGSFPAAFSLRVLAHMEDRTGKPASEALDAILDSGRVTDSTWLLAELLAAGAKIEGGVTPPTVDELLDNLTLDDMHAITANILVTVRTAKPSLNLDSKNGEAKPRRALRTLFG